MNTSQVFEYKSRGDKRPPIFHQFYDSWSWKPNAIGVDAMPKPVVGEAAPMKNLEDVFELQILRWWFGFKMVNNMNQFDENWWLCWQPPDK